MTADTSYTSYYALRCIRGSQPLYQLLAECSSQDAAERCLTVNAVVAVPPKTSHTIYKAAPGLSVAQVIKTGVSTS